MNYLYYFLNKNDEIIYFGKTSNIYNRMKQHFFKGHLPKECYDSTYKIMYTELINNKYDTEIYETYYINKYKPIYNIDKKFTDKITNTFELDLTFKELYISFYQDQIIVDKEYKYPLCYNHHLSKSEQCKKMLDYNIGIIQHHIGIFDKYLNTLYNENKRLMIDILLNILNLVRNNINLDISDTDIPIVFSKDYFSGGYVAFDINILKEVNLKDILLLVNTGIINRINKDIYGIPIFINENLNLIEQLYKTNYLL